MGLIQSITHFQRDSGKLSVRVVTDPAGRIETPASPNPRIAVHLGRSVYMACERGGMRHAGWAVHGDIEIVPADTSCIWEPKDTDTALIVSVDRDLVASAAQEAGASGEQLQILNRFQVRDSQIEHICWAIKAEMDLGCPNGRIFLDSLSIALATALACRHSSLAVKPLESKNSMTGHRLRQALSYIEDNLEKDMSLADIAQAAGLSVSHLKSTFREATGLPVHQYVIQRRVERAKTLLCQGESSISAVAVETGFAHPSHLAKHMRRILGCSPKTVRKRGF